MFKLILARQLGAKCYWDYFTILHNPFEADTEEFDEWEDGWYETVFVEGHGDWEILRRHLTSYDARLYHMAKTEQLGLKLI